MSFYPVVTTPIVVSFASPITMSAGSRRMVWSGGATPCILGRAASGHVSGSTLVVEFAPSTATSLSLAASFNTEGDGVFAPLGTGAVGVTDWDATKAHLLFLEQVDTYTKASLFEVVGRGSSTPSIATATIDGSTPNRLTITSTGGVPLYLRGVVTGLSLTGTGVTETITGIASGDGTATVVLTLSGSLAGTETGVALVVGGSRVIGDYDSNLIATGSTSVTMAFGLSSAVPAYTVVFESNRSMLPATSLPAAATSWKDEVGGTLQLTPGSSSAPLRTAAPNASMLFAPSTGTDFTQRLTCTLTTALTSGTDFSILVRFGGSGADNATVLSFSSPTHPTLYITLAAGGASVSAATNDGSVEVVATLTITPDTANHVYFIERVGTSLTVQQDGGSPCTAGVTSQDLTHCNVLTVGCGLLSNGAFFLAGHCDLTDLTYIPNRAATAPEKAAALAYIASR